MTRYAAPAEMLHLDGHIITVTLTVPAKGLYAAYCAPCGNTFVSGFNRDFTMHRAAFHARQCECAPVMSEAFPAREATAA